MSDDTLSESTSDLLEFSTSDATLAMVLEHTPALFTVLDLEGRMIYINRTMTPHLKVEDLMGKRPSEYLPEPNNAVWDEAVQRAIQTKMPQRIEVDSIREFSWESQIIPIVEDGEVTKLLTIAEDISSQRITQFQLKQSKERLKLAIESVGIGMWEWVVGQDTVSWDTKTCQIFGKEDEGVPVDYSAYLALLHPDDRDRVADHINRSVEVGVFEALDHRIIRHGAERWLRCHATVRTDADGNAQSIIGGVYDVTDQHRAELIERQSQKMAALGRLTAGIAHNFNNMLTAILPNIELAMMEAPPELNDRLQEAENAALRASEMIRQLMIFSRPPSGEGATSIDLRDVVRDVFDMCRTAFNRRFEMTLKLPDEPVIVEGDATQLEQAILNICLNARDATTDESYPTIIVSLETDGSRARIAVDDNGIGVAPDSLTRVFEPFFTTKPVGKGTGLGLATTYAIVQDHRGHLYCESVVSEGARFVIELPVFEGELDSVSSSDEHDALVHSARVLVIDDEPPVRRAVSSMLRIHGFDVEERANGQDGLDYLEHNIVDLIIVDLWMPKMGGTEMISRLPADRDFKVVVLSGAPVPDSLEAVVDAVWMKPVRKKELLRQLAVLLGPQS